VVAVHAISSQGIRPDPSFILSPGYEGALAALLTFAGFGLLTFFVVLIAWGKFVWMEDDEGP
jgi:hypothetical protein